ncbi:MAG: cytochrome c oxidase subunit 3 [Vicinamibacteria bacterium]
MTVTLPARTPSPFLEWPAYRLAVWALLVNEAFLFGTVLAAGFFLRFAGTVPWPRPGDALALGPVLLATVILIASSATLNESLDALRRNNPYVSRRWLVWTLLAGTIFLGIQSFEWWELKRAATALSANPGVPLTSNPWGAASFMQIFFLATGLHGLHVLVGLLLMAWLLGANRETDVRYLESVALYWHFVDLVWIFIVSSLYFL